MVTAINTNYLFLSIPRAAIKNISIIECLQNFGIDEADIRFCGIKKKRAYYKIKLSAVSMPITEILADVLGCSERAIKSY